MIMALHPGAPSASGSQGNGGQHHRHHQGLPPPPHRSRPPPPFPIRDAWVEVKTIESGVQFSKRKQNWCLKMSHFFQQQPWSPVRNHGGDADPEIYESIYDSRWRLLNQVRFLKKTSCYRL